MDNSSVSHYSTGKPVPQEPDEPQTSRTLTKAFSRACSIMTPEEAQARRILQLLFRQRRLLADELSVPGDFEREAEPHLAKLTAAVKNRECIHMILPGFPAKSPNRRKTLGPLPDLADKHGLENLHKLCNEIAAGYPPGAKITICSDGHVFSDLICIPDEDVTAYGDALRRHAAVRHGETFGFFNLNDAFEKITAFDILREELLIRYGESIVSLRHRCKSEKDAKAVYRGITRFIFEDYSGIEPFMRQSRNAIQTIARLVSYRVIQRSNAWTRLLEERFGGAIRLSIHPQYRVSRKIGVYLADTGGDCWLTPWHSVAVKCNGKITLRKRAEAECNSVLAFEDGHPSHFEQRERGADKP